MGRATLGEISTADTLDSRCSFQMVHKRYLLQEVLIMKKKHISMEPVVKNMWRFVELHQHSCGPLRVVQDHTIHGIEASLFTLHSVSGVPTRGGALT